MERCKIVGQREGVDFLLKTRVEIFFLVPVSKVEDVSTSVSFRVDWKEGNK